MATDWHAIFKRRPDLAPEGYEAAIKLAAARTEQRRLVKECRKATTRGRNGERS